MTERDDRLALLREGIVLLRDEAQSGLRRVEVAGMRFDLTEVVARVLGRDVEIDVVGDTPRIIRPRRVLGYREREPCRLQLRIAVRGEEHVDEILVEEDDATVVVHATVCTAIDVEAGEWVDCPFHVYLEHPLGDRDVIDGVSGKPVPFRPPR
jgi:hypothetical protein